MSFDIALLWALAALFVLTGAVALFSLVVIFAAVLKLLVEGWTR